VFSLNATAFAEEEEVVVKADLVSHGYVLAVEDEVVEEEPPVFVRAIRELTKRVVEFFTGWI